jgi:hypothetical protein
VFQDQQPKRHFRRCLRAPMRPALAMSLPLCIVHTLHQCGVFQQLVYFFHPGFPQITLRQRRPVLSQACHPLWECGQLSIRQISGASVHPRNTPERSRSAADASRPRINATIALPGSQVQKLSGADRRVEWRRRRMSGHKNLSLARPIYLCGTDAEPRVSVLCSRPKFLP